VTDATYFGYQGALQWRRDLFDVIDDGRFVVADVLASGPDCVVIANRLVGRGSTSGVPVELPWVSVLRFRDGKLAHGAGYRTRREALEALGRRE
jgi:ketosteroid isomerase-like protein